MSARWFTSQIGRVSTTDVLNFMERRYAAMYTGATSLLSRAPGGDNFKPFDGSKYVHSKQMPYEERVAARVLDVTTLAHPNPFMPSECRGPGTFRCWDATTCIPATGPRAGGVKLLGDITPLRNINDHWLDKAERIIARAGPLGEAGELIRPLSRCQSRCRAGQERL
jgi:hypothetical protein